MGFWKRFIRRANRRRSAFLTLLSSYIAIFLLPVMIGAVVYDKVEGIMVENASRSNKAMLEQVRLAVDNRMSEVEKLAVQISLNPKLQWLLDSKDYGDSQELYKFIEFMKDLARYGTVSSSINNFYVYFANTDTVLTPSMRTNSRMYYNEISGYKDVSYDAYREQVLEGYHLRSILPSAALRNDARVVTYAQSLPLGERTAPKGTLIILVDEKQIRDLLEQIEWVNSGSIYILNEDRDIVMTTASDDELSARLKSRLNTGQDYLSYVNDAGREMMVTYTSSADNGWTYVSVVPKNIVLAKVMTVKSWAVSLVLVCLLGGAVASYSMAYKNYRPIREVVNALVQGRSMPRDRSSNEYDFIKQSIASSIAEERRLQRTISKQAPVIQADFLSRLVRGHVDASSITDEDLRFMGVSFLSDRFCVVLVDVDDGKRFMREDSEKEWALVRFVVGNLGGELLGEAGHSIEMERNRVLFLISLPEREPETSAYLSDFVRQLRELLDGRFLTQVTLAISRVHRGLGKIAEGYGEAILALDYKLIKGHHSIIYYDDLAELELGHYHYPTAVEAQLMNYVKSGDFENAETALNQIYEVNFHAGGLTPEMGKCLFFDLVSTYFKLAATLGPAETPFGEPDPAKWVSGGATAEEMFRRTKALFRQLCERMDSERPRPGDQLYQRIQRYVEAHVPDGNLGLNAIADHFGMNPAYLSSFFKKHCGENVSDYIARVRVSESKKLLRDTDWTLAEIAEKVGYAGSVGLIRVFKKLEGITPGQYRANLENEERITVLKNR
ncbi:AraC family transcriptional regulator [Paenibacillus antri]|uniref:AraC family transcriptional regulator n=1 Tax=Paenibacillus antri TaxID=2582848 RepID=A0A5R9GCS1_9BACL|nr:helix-turn-helix domain-containing protein [Paenibacillus antri]TLS52126.1 AraC family transcriptional regulator [Paenibacillus antri]